MADKTTGELPAVKVGDLPLAPDVYDDSMFPVELQGLAMHITGAQWKRYAVAAVKIYSDSANKAATTAQTAADRAEAARDSVVVDESKLAQAVSDASASATSAKASADKSAQSAADAEESANRAQAEAERVTVPAAAGVYNVILTDRVTAERYALIVENGRLAILGVSETLEATDMNLIDSATGTAYAVVVESGRLALKEV
ncbi:MAG: hypothetical protein IJ955_10350 [Oscillospiraceae bacterium]|nr:hypothetical protein [Oscillospiraceae bacterium]